MSVNVSTTVAATYGCDNYSKVLGFHASAECEVESITGLAPKQIGNWCAKADGSLRNGVEYVSMSPRTRELLVADFQALHKTLKFGENPFSERTSTHVHVNIQTLTLDQVRTMVLLYALFEEFFFSMVKPIRRDNIHCVPLTETYLPSEYFRTIDGLYHKWHKYTALNLKRMVDLGTLEFRHMHATDDSAEMDMWLHVLENLWKLCQRVTVDTKSLSDKALITEWFELLFFPCDRVMALRPSLFDIIKNSLIDVKFSTIVPANKD